MKLILQISLFFIICCSHVSFGLDFSTCGTEKTCVLHPPGCFANDSLCVGFSYAWNPVDNVFNMELSGSGGSGSQYISVGFSPDGLMSNSEVYVCTGEELRSGVIAIRHTEPHSDTTLVSGVTSTEASTVDGVAQCSFTRVPVIHRTIGGDNVTFDLSTTQYHVIQAVGDFFSFGLNLVFPHDINDRYSTGPYAFVPQTNTPSATTRMVTSMMAETTRMTTTVEPETSALPRTTASSTTAPTTTPEQLPPTTTATATLSTTDDADDTCGVTRGCFQFPDMCTPGSSNCLFATWNFDVESSAFNIEIMGGANEEYVAIAFAPNPQMESADLYYCTKDGLFTGAIAGRYSMPNVDATLPDGISNVVTTANEGVLRCAFTRSSSMEKRVFDEVLDFDLMNSQYHLLIASGGAVKIGDLQRITYHSANRTASSSPINFTKFRYIRPTTNPVMTTSNSVRHLISNALLLLSFLLLLKIF